MSDGVRAILTEAGFEIKETERSLSGERTVVSHRWLLGRRKVRHWVECRLDLRLRKVSFREGSVSTDLGIPPPVFVFSIFRQRGATVEREAGWGIAPGAPMLSLGRLGGRMRECVEGHGWLFEETVVN